jgi:PDZ domain
VPLRCALAVTVLGIALSAPAAAGVGRTTANSAVCGQAPPRTALALRGTIDALERWHGRFDELIDPASGRFVRHWSLGGFGESTGSDGTTAWVQDRSRTVHRLDAVHARRVAATDAWFARRGWCAADALGAVLTGPVQRAQGGRAFDVVQAVPRGGVPVEIWFDRASGLPDRTVLRLNEDTRVERFSDWRESGGTVVPFVRRIEYPEDGDVETLTAQTLALHRAPRAAEFAPPPAPDDVRMARGARSTTVPIRIEAHKMLVDVRLNGLGPFPFVLDSGGHFIVTAATARRLAASAPARGRAGDAARRLPLVRVRELRIGDAIVRDNVARLTAYSFARLERGPLPPKAGWLGLELFERFSVVIDPDERTLTLTPLRARAPRYAGVRIPLTLDEDAPLVPCRIAGARGECMVDTGNAGATIVEGYWAHQRGLAPRFARGLDAGSGVRVARADVEVGTVHAPREIVAAYPQARSGSESTTVEAAILSETLHERFVTAIDYRQGAMWLAPARHGTTWPFNRTGMQLRRQPGGTFEVVFVFARSPAAAAGLHPGDRIIAIDGKPARTVTPNELLAASSAPVGTLRTYRVRAAKPALPRTVRIRLAELLP